MASGSRPTAPGLDLQSRRRPEGELGRSASARLIIATEPGRLSVDRTRRPSQSWLSALDPRRSQLDCVFCDRLTRGDLVAVSEHAAAFPDAFPLNVGHCLIVPRRHETEFFALTAAEQADVWALVPAVRHHIEATRMPDGYNIGINIGEAAGQTVSHAHLHVIPRYRADVSDPRGGIRWVIPARAQYWETR